jgi:hypothetical protein
MLMYPIPFPVNMLAIIEAADFIFFEESGIEFSVKLAILLAVGVVIRRVVAKLRRKGAL